jgi:hypothetical protein
VILCRRGREHRLLDGQAVLADSAALNYLIFEPLYLSELRAFRRGTEQDRVRVLHFSQRARRIGPPNAHELRELCLWLAHSVELEQGAGVVGPALEVGADGELRADGPDGGEAKCGQRHRLSRDLRPPTGVAEAHYNRPNDM